MAKYKIGIDAGHGGSDAGAVKYVVEKDANLVIALAMEKYLKLYPEIKNIYMSRTKDVGTSLNGLCADFNRKKVDLAVSVHNNAGGGDGCEFIHQILSAKSKKLAKCIEDRTKKLGQNSRGLKTKSRATSKTTDFFGFNRMIKAPSVICEGFFVDNKTDVKIADTIDEQRMFGYAYSKGILDYLGIKCKTVYITTQALNVHESASIKSNSIGKILKDKLLVATKCPDGWLKINYNDKTGYIRAETAKKKYCKEV